LSNGNYQRGPSNRLRIDLYRFLFSRVIEEDQESGAYGHIFHWDDPGDPEWDSGDPNDVWDRLGFSPVVQTLFYVLETMEGEDIGVIEDLSALVDPYTCPVDHLPLLAASFGYDLEESISEGEKRVVVAGIIDAYKVAGRWIGFKVFYRLAGFEVIHVYPLYKKRAHEEDGDYSRVRYSASVVAGESIGPGGQTGYTGRLASTPVRPQSVRITDGATVVRDDPPTTPSGLMRGTTAPLIGPNGETGMVDYSTGVFTLNFPSPTVGAVTTDYERVDEEWPYHAARIDIEILLNPGGDLINPVPLVDAEVARNILSRAEESRPIHVLLRSLALVSELHDDGPGASDQQACLTKLKDVRDGSLALSVPGRDYTYMLDFVPDLAEDAGTIDEIVGGILARRTHLFEEQGRLACPMDALLIEGPPGGTVYA